MNMPIFPSLDKLPKSIQLFTSEPISNQHPLLPDTALLILKLALKFVGKFGIDNSVVDVIECEL